MFALPPTADISRKSRHATQAVDPNIGHLNSLPPVEGDERRRCNSKKRKTKPVSRWGAFEFVYFWQSCGTLSLRWHSSLVQRVS
jgi:hypothetical protein